MPARKKIGPGETFVTIDVSALFTSIPVPVALEVINRKFTGDINQEGMENFLVHTCFILRDKCMSLLELGLKNCVFSFQGNSTGNSKELQWVHIYLQSLPISMWNTLKRWP